MEGKEELKINEDTKKAIEEGRLIVPSWMRDYNMELEKDFDNTQTPDSVKFSRIDPYSMPPAVFALYVLYMDKQDPTDQLQSLIISFEDRERLKALTPAGGMDFNHLLSMVFSSHYRQLARNRKNATAYKNYHDNGISAPASIRFTERERQQLIRSSNTYRPPVKITSGNRNGGIDN